MKDDDLGLINTAFTKQEDYKELWLEHERYYQSEFSDKALKRLEKNKRSKLFISTTRNTVNIVRSIFSTSFFSSGCPIELINLNDIGGETESDLTKVIKYYYKKLKPEKELNKAFLSALIFNMGIVTTYWCKTKKRVITSHIPITDIAFDPSARNIDDVEYFAYRFNESLSSIKFKFKKKIYKEKKISKVFSKEELENIDSRRVKVKEIYKREGDGWIYKTYINNHCVRKSFIKSPPFNWGICLETIAAIDESKRAAQNLVYGESLVNLIKTLNDEINQKRNQKNDIQEEMINPSALIADDASMNVNDLKKGPGKKIRVKGKLSSVQFLPSPSEYSLNQDLQFLDKDLNESSGVNSIQAGNTSTSDRRSAQALAVVNSNSTTRISEMISLINETLFEHWAKDFVRLILLNAEDKIINKITNKEYPFGKKGKRDSFEYEMEINFGNSIDKEKRMSDLVNILLPVLQNPNINPVLIERILKEVLSGYFGDNAMLEEIFIKPQEEGEAEKGDAREEEIARELQMMTK
ncbi:MAG: hypothetical protein COB42_08160 [Sulfurimonas sp.]|nr:MAG: hypothetical protein COB42_08160 [Sulfurimonas sp.]